MTILCKKCNTERRETQFSLKKNGKREQLCRYCNYDGTTADDKAEIIKEAYRHYDTWQNLIAYGDGKSGHVSDVLTYHIPKEPGSDELVPIVISFHDLQRAWDNVKLAPRKKEAFELNILQDMLQREAADIMGITTVSVGQYVNQAASQLAEWYFADEDRRKVIEESFKVSDYDHGITDERN